MKAWQLQDWDRSSLKLIEASKPKIINDYEVLVNIKAASLNFRDLIMASGGYGKVGGKIPLIPISDGSGRVVELGKKVKSLKVGDIVVPSFFQNWIDGPAKNNILESALGGPLDGVMQEYMLFNEEGLVKNNTNLNIKELAALPCAGVTAWRALVEIGKIKKNDIVLIQGTGGVGLIGLQLAKALGAEVIIISSNDKKLDFALSLGADSAINYKKYPKWSEKIKEITNGQGVDLIIELGGKSTFSQSIKAIKFSGTIVVIGVLGGGTVELPIGLAITKLLNIKAIACGSKDDLINLLNFIKKKDIKPIIDKEFYFEELVDSMNYMEKGMHLGKIILNNI